MGSDMVFEPAWQERERATAMVRGRWWQRLPQGPL